MELSQVVPHRSSLLLICRYNFDTVMIILFSNTKKIIISK